MKVLITGANGLLGHHVVMQLQKMYCDIKVLLRGNREIYFDLSNIELVIGNFTDYETLKKAAEGCDAIIHIAALTSTNLLYYNDYSKINVDGSAMIIKVANEQNIKKIVFVSTANTIGHGSLNNTADEFNHIDFPFSKSFYAQSKLEAEKLFIEASKMPDRHVIIINPTFMIGSHDTKPSSGKLILMGYKKRFNFVPSGGKNFVAVSDVATAICNALTMGNNGHRYLASGVNLSFKEFYKLQSRVGGYNQKIIILPTFLLVMIGKIGDVIRLFGIKTEICSMNLNQLIVQEYYNNEKAVTQLAMPQKPIHSAINEAINWFKENGKID
jgi:nucleoside-diphosphate-sugar epimerase